MALGPGKYDDALTKARTECGATGALLVVLDGAEGVGFSCQAPLPLLATLPEMLRFVASQIEADLRRGQL